ncbi:DNA polymerase III subunit beta [Candidatus Phytoplasma ziziphi]|uniref:Beta sliding clamp n=1 Tax=Ziziphus jujuba witches'-broom phytoplasma TaxID=135727 RepID=A0A660HMT6_ZIZJU|nr:DNA polymerase III subunit beta [Candidatus Phytoplasma ziziphi]AYJ01179.1 DNA polymerase III subunit beta [Candidatus Phytoplasma ziziphi]
MNFEIKKEVFLHYLNQIQKILPQKTFFPIYYYIKIDLKKDVLFLEVNNSHIFVKIKVEDESLKVYEEGIFIVLGRNFIDIIKKIDYHLIKIDSVEDKFLIIKTDYSYYKLKLMELDNYHSVDFIFDYQNCFEIEMELFKKLIKEMIIVSSKDKQQNILTGVNLIYKSPFLISVATDSFRLGQKKIKLKIDYYDFNIIIPARSLEELLKLLEQQKDEIVQISITEQKFFLKTNSLFFQSPLLEGNYPEAPPIKKESLINFFRLNRNNLIKVLDRVSLFLPKDKNIFDNAVEFKTNSNYKLEIFSDSEEIGHALEEIEILESSFDSNIKSFFNVKYLEEILKVFTSEQITFFFENSSKPFFIMSEEDETILYLISPFYFK